MKGQLESLLKEALKGIGLAEGQVYNKSMLDKVEQEMRGQYYSQGKYSVNIDTTVTPLERNRVGISFDISEGVVAKIKEINIVGNEAYDNDEMSSQRAADLITQIVKIKQNIQNDHSATLLKRRVADIFQLDQFHQLDLLR